MTIVRTERLHIREIDSALDAEFIFELLNSAKFIRYIGDRGVRSADDAVNFINDRLRQSYRDNGYGLFTVELHNETPLGICGFVKRPQFDHADLGFAFLPQHERKGYGLESATAMLSFGRDSLGFGHVLAITSQDNDASGKLLEKLGFAYTGLETMPDGEVLKLFSIDL